MSAARLATRFTMHPPTLIELWSQYTAQPLDTTVHPQDDMFKKSGNDWAPYNSVGESAARVIFSSLAVCPVERVARVLDFGCGHGRVARHLRALFPGAELFFSDIDEAAAKFCASQFRGEAVPACEEFSQVRLPADLDLIFLGSVFTHLDWSRAQTLWTQCFRSLRAGGALVGTFRGRTAYRMMLSNPQRHNANGYYAPMIASYLSHGFGYQDYKGFTRWGQNLFAPTKYQALSEPQELARMVGLTEAGWANIHDVVTWTRRTNWSQ